MLKKSEKISFWLAKIKARETDLIFVAVVVLTALLSFSFGRWSADRPEKGEIIIQNPLPASVQTTSRQEDVLLNSPEKEKRFVGSINSNKYHHPECPWGRRIAPENQIWFSSEEEAKAAGYVRCGNFDKYFSP